MKTYLVVAVGFVLFSIVAHAAEADRTAYARRVEALFLENGFDAFVSADGSQRDTLHIKYALMNRPFIYKFMSRGTFSAAGKLGFRKLLFEGDRSVWRYYWDGNEWQAGRPPAELAAEKAQRARERAREEERQRKLDEAAAEMRKREEDNLMQQPCPNGMKRRRTSYGTYCQ